MHTLYYLNPMKTFRYLPLLLLVLASCGSPRVFRQHWLKEKAPGYFKARFETTEGDFEMEAYREWSPAAVDRLYQLIRHQYFNGAPLYRVLPDFVAQFGSPDSARNAPWNTVLVPDEPVIKTNAKGVIAFARSGKNSRSNQIFINTKDNHRLDTLHYNGVTGFPGIAVVTKGMETALRFHSYGEKVHAVPDSLHGNPDGYLRRHFPELDYIKKAVIIK